MCNEAKSEQHFAATIAKRIAIFYASLKLLTQQARDQL